MTKPFQDEYPEYYNIYVNLVPEGDLIQIFEKQTIINQEFLKTIPEEKGDYTYAFGKWSIKEILGHLMDTERIFSCRALRIARGDKQPLPGFEQDDYVKKGNFFRRSLKDLMDERLMLRGATIKLFSSFDEHEMMERGVTNDHDITVRAILHILIGHEIHHIKFIKENYFNNK